MTHLIGWKGRLRGCGGTLWSASRCQNVALFWSKQLKSAGRYQFLTRFYDIDVESIAPFWAIYVTKCGKPSGSSPINMPQPALLETMSFLSKSTKKGNNLLSPGQRNIFCQATPPCPFRSNLNLITPAKLTHIFVPCLHWVLMIMINVRGPNSPTAMFEHTNPHPCSIFHYFLQRKNLYLVQREIIIDLDQIF